jgi:LacI family transcriptional regulator, xylobiose transport system transcriptional regulator
MILKFSRNVLAFATDVILWEVVAYPAHMTTGTAGSDARGRRRRGDLTVARIARMAGVSPPTVSKVLNGRPGVSASTRSRIEELIREQGYRRDPKVESSPLVELVFPLLSTPWALEIIQGVERVLQPHGLAATVTEMRGEHTPVRGWIDDVLARRPVAVVGVSVQLSSAQHAQLSSRGIPVVNLDPTGEPSHPTPSVGAMNWNGGLAAARHLLEFGHRRIAMINGSPGEFVCCRAREDGYRAGLEAAAVRPDPALFRVAPLYMTGGLAEAADLLRLTKPPTAIFAANDLQALGVYEAARRAGVRIPQDLSVVGFDDLPFVQWLGPPLTTVRQPLMQMGATAADMALTLANGGQLDYERIELPTTLMVRQSTGPPAR